MFQTLEMIKLSNYPIIGLHEWYVSKVSIVSFDDCYQLFNVHLLVNYTFPIDLYFFT